MATHQLVTLLMVNLVMAVLVIQIVPHFQAVLIPLVLVCHQLYLVLVLGRNYIFHSIFGGIFKKERFDQIFVELKYLVILAKELFLES